MPLAIIDHAALVVGDARVGSRRRQEDGSVGAGRRGRRDPAHLAVSDIGANLEAERVAV
jgi:hypothetical protein